jgi:predicted metal-dependent hydrolase
MQIEIAGKNYQIIITDSKVIRLEQQQDTAILYAPADIDVSTLEQFIKNNSVALPFPEEVEYQEQPVQLFQQNYLLKLIKNSKANKISVKNRTITLHCKGITYQKQLHDWQKQFILRQLSNQIGYWEEKLNVLVGTIKLRALRKSLYSLQTEHNITFSTSVTCLSIPELHYLTFKAIASQISLDSKIRTTYFPDEQQLEHQIAYTLKTCQQSH